MWLFTIYGFFSISILGDSVLVRGRAKPHLLALQKRFPLLGDKIVETPEHDYRYRIQTTRPVWVTVMAALAEEQDWSNFKNQAYATRPEDKKYNAALHDVWDVMFKLQLP